VTQHDELAGPCRQCEGQDAGKMKNPIHAR
jgi:hypothetical protein